MLRNAFHNKIIVPHLIRMDNISILDKLYLVSRWQLIARTISHIYMTIRLTRNWHDVLLGNRKPRIFKDGKAVSPKDFLPTLLSKHFGLIEGKDCYSFDYKGRRVTLQGKPAPFSLIEIFVEEEYRFMDVRDRMVVDIGASIGDSAMYFILNGADHVIVFEPYPYSYDKAIVNLEANGVSDAVTLVRKGVGRERLIRLPSAFESGAGDSIKDSEDGLPTEIISLESLVRDYPVKDSILKVDCEGDEYPIILESSDEILRNFSEIGLEYHQGYLDLEKRLQKAGFSTRRVNRIRKRYNPEAGMCVFSGLIHAKRLDDYHHR
jgi:FkbM family methyltransferase